MRPTGRKGKKNSRFSFNQTSNPPLVYLWNFPKKNKICCHWCNADSSSSNTLSVSIYLSWKLSTNCYRKGSIFLNEAVMILLIRGWNFAAWKKPDSYLGGVNSDHATVYFAAMALLSSLCPILHRSEPQLSLLLKMISNPRKNGDISRMVDHLRYVNEFVFCSNQ